MLIPALVITLSCARNNDIRYFNLNNGLKVVFNHDSTPITSAVLVIGAGSSLKPYKAADILTKSIFEGSTIRTRQQIFQEIEMMGGRLRFWTTDAVSIIQIRAPSSSFLKCFSIVCETISHPLFNDAHIRKVLDDAGPAALGSNHLNYQDERDDVRSLLFSDSDLVRAAGASASNMSAKLIKKYYETYFRPENIITAVSGSFTNSSILQVLSTCWPPAETGKAYTRPSINTGKRAETTALFKEASGSTGKLVIAYRAPGTIEPDYYKTVLLSKIIGDGLNSTVRNALDGAGLTSSRVHSYYARDYGYGYVVLRIKAPEHEYERMRDTVIAAIDTVRNAGINPEQFIIGKRKVLFDAAFRMQYSSFKALILASQVRSGSCLCPDDYRDRIVAIDIEELNRYAAVFLDAPVIISYEPR